MAYDRYVKYVSDIPRKDIDAPYFYSGNKEEWLPIYRPDGTPLQGAAGAQTTVLFAPTHIYGLYHQSVNVIFLVQQGEDVFIVTSQRAFDIFPFPGAYSVSVGGHIKAGESAVENAIKETREELGLNLAENRFIAIGNTHRGHPLFGKDWEYVLEDRSYPIKITQFDPAGKDLIITKNGDFPRREEILAYIQQTPGSSLTDARETPNGLFLRNFNREYGFYYLVILSAEEYGARTINPTEVASSRLIPWRQFFQFISDLNQAADAFYTLHQDPVLRAAFIGEVEKIQNP